MRQACSDRFWESGEDIHAKVCMRFVVFAERLDLFAVVGGGAFIENFMKKKTQFTEDFADIISVDNLLLAWKEFKKGKSKKEGVQLFQLRLMDYILSLHEDLRNQTYQHGPYKHFRIADPKPRDIHKASVRDRLLHHAIYRKLYPFFARTFISDSFSCRIGKGTHRAMNRFRSFAYKVSKNHTRTCFVLKCDIRKFFANIDHEILFSILSAYIPDADILWLLKEVVGSFHSLSNSRELESDRKAEAGLPLGNLTSQLFVNIYMNEFGQFVKHKLKVKYYIRYADDFVIFSHDKVLLERLILQITQFLQEWLKLSLHPDKVFIKTIASGVDFLGWVHFHDHRVLRTTTKRRMFRRVAENPKEESVASYLGMLSHGNTWKLRKKIANQK